VNARDAARRCTAAARLLLRKVPSEPITRIRTCPPDTQEAALRPAWLVPVSLWYLPFVTKCRSIALRFTPTIHYHPSAFAPYSATTRHSIASVPPAGICSSVARSSGLSMSTSMPCSSALSAGMPESRNSRACMGAQSNAVTSTGLGLPITPAQNGWSGFGASNSRLDVTRAAVRSDAAWAVPLRAAAG
jgi:hypothetical protein